MNPLMLLLLTILPAAAFLIGAWVARGHQPNILLTKSERKELRAQRVLISDLTAISAEHATLGDPFAVAALSRINQYQKEIR